MSKKLKKEMNSEQECHVSDFVRMSSDLIQRSKLGSQNDFLILRSLLLFMFTWRFVIRGGLACSWWKGCRWW